MSKAAELAAFIANQSSANVASKNIIINGNMAVAQRATSSTSTGYQTVDRFQMGTSGVDEGPTQAQVDVSSGTTPYTLGFKKALKITNGNQTSGADAGDIIDVKHGIEAQHIAQSGWDFKSASSFVTLSFWVKSSVAQNFFGLVRTFDGTAFNFPFSTGSLTADTWTKVTKTIPGNSNLTIDTDNGEGLQIRWHMFLGTDRTASVTEDTWVAFDTTQRTPDNTSTWYTTNDATFEITGVQLEVGEVATPFKHESFGDNLKRCKRYFIRYSNSGNYAIGAAEDGTRGIFAFPAPDMRAAPTGTQGTLTLGGGIGSPPAVTAISSVTNSGHGLDLLLTVGSGLTAKDALRIRATDTASFLAFDAEL